MPARSSIRGWPVFWNGSKWIYDDTGSEFDDKRPCRHCGKLPTLEGYDACLGKLPNVWSACCGHSDKSRIIRKEIDYDRTIGIDSK